MAAPDTIDVQTKYVVLPIQVPRNTTVQTATFVLGQRVLQSLDVFFAPGHVGLVGVRIFYSGVAILPWNQPNNFLVGSNERRVFQLALPIDNDIQIDTRNLDAKFSHAVVITAALTELPTVSTAAPPPIMPLVDKSA